MKYVNTTSIQMENVLPDPLCFNEGPTASPHARQLCNLKKMSDMNNVDGDLSKQV